MEKSTMRWIGLICITVASSWAPVRAEVPTYQVEFLGAGTNGTGMNELGVVCGNVPTEGSVQRAAVWHVGQPFELLPLPAGMTTSRAWDINDAGVIVGDVGSSVTAAVWRPTATGYEVEVLGGLPGDPSSIAWAINNVGDIIGASGFWYWNPDHPILYTESGPTPLAYYASDINDQRVIVSGPRLIDLDTGVVTNIPLPPGNWNGFVSAAINNNNDFCGYILGWSGCSTFPLRYRQGVGWEFLGGCATTTSATAINDRGDALSYYYMTTAGVTFVSEGYFGLGSLIDPSAGEYYIQYGGANAINNSRQIVAGARQGFNGPIGAIRMTPIVPVMLGDLDCDGEVTPLDIEPFVLALIDSSGYAAAFPACDRLRADGNGDVAVDGLDIAPFVRQLSGI